MRVKCITDMYRGIHFQSRLQVDKWYNAEYYTPSGHWTHVGKGSTKKIYTISNIDGDKIGLFHASLFITGEEWRENQLNEILDGVNL